MAPTGSLVAYSKGHALLGRWPGLTGRGLGVGFVLACVDFALRQVQGGVGLASSRIGEAGTAFARVGS